MPPGAVRVADPDELRGFFADEPQRHIYAIADLDEPYWSVSTWWRRDDAVVGFVQLPDDPQPLVYAVASRNPEATLVLLAECHDAIAPGVLITGPSGLRDALSPLREIRWCRPHSRYHLTAPELLSDPGTDVVPLGPQDLPAIETLYATDPGAAFFRPFFLEMNTFFGVFDAERLVSIAGTHVVSERSSVAAVGSVLSHPDYRGQGLAQRTSAAVCRALLPRVQMIGLNVADDNPAAVAVYESLGFTRVAGYDEAELGGPSLRSRS